MIFDLSCRGDILSTYLKNDIEFIGLDNHLMQPESQYCTSFEWSNPKAMLQFDTSKSILQKFGAKEDVKI